MERVAWHDRIPNTTIKERTNLFDILEIIKHYEYGNGHFM